MEVELSIARAGESREETASCVIGGRVVFGRDLSSPVQLEGTGISREHFAVSSTDGRVYIEDLSTNGTWLNGQRLPKREQRILTKGDVVEVPGTRISVSWEEQPQQSNVIAPSQPPVVAPAPAARWPWLNPIGAFLTSFSLLEKFAILSSLCSLLFVLLYSLD